VIRGYHTSTIQALCSIPKGGGAPAQSNCGSNAFLSGSYDRTIRLWNTDSHLPLCTATYEGHERGVTVPSAVTSSAFVSCMSSDAFLLVLWWCEQSLALLPCGTQFLSGSDDRTVRVWDLQKGTCVTRISWFSSGITCVSVPHPSILPHSLMPGTCEQPAWFAVSAGSQWFVYRSTSQDKKHASQQPELVLQGTSPLHSTNIQSVTWLPSRKCQTRTALRSSSSGSDSAFVMCAMLVCEQVNW
jgi:hypothetical protein